MAVPPPGGCGNRPRWDLARSLNGWSAEHRHALGTGRTIRQVRATSHVGFGSAVVAAVVTVTFVLTGGTAQAEPGFSPIKSVPVPAGSLPTQVSYDAVSCPAPNSCTAVGGPISGDHTPSVVTETSGSWSTAQSIPIPSGAATGALNAVSCPSVGNCLAVGSYQFPGEAGPTEPLVEGETAGTWSQSAGPSLPSDTLTDPYEYATFSAVWCASPGNCEVAGTYETKAGTGPLMAAVEASGTWGTAVALPVAPGSQASAYPPELACSSIGNCTATAVWAARVCSGHGCASVRESYGWAETDGTWASPIRIGTAAMSDAFLVSGLACPSTTTCIAVGETSEPREQPTAAIDTSGTWAVPKPLVLPDLSPVTSSAFLEGISCEPGVCVSVGGGGPSATQYHPLAATWRAGSWSSIGLERVDPARHGESNASWLGSVACASTTSCLAIGDAGVFSARILRPEFPYSSTITPALVVAAPGPPTAVRAVPGIASARVSWQPPSEDGGAPITSFTARAEPGGHVCRSRGTSCTITELSNGTRYRLSVTDANGHASSPAAVTRSFVAGAVPSPPSGEHVITSGGTASVRWSAATSPRREPVLRYLVFAAPASPSGQRGCVTHADSCVVRNLVKGEGYRLSIIAVDASGRSAAATMRFVAG